MKKRRNGLWITRPSSHISNGSCPNLRSLLIRKCWRCSIWNMIAGRQYTFRGLQSSSLSLCWYLLFICEFDDPNAFMVLIHLDSCNHPHHCWNDRHMRLRSRFCFRRASLSLIMFTFSIMDFYMEYWSYPWYWQGRSRPYFWVVCCSRRCCVWSISTYISLRHISFTSFERIV